MSFAAKTASTYASARRLPGFTWNLLDKALTPLRLNSIQFMSRPQWISQSPFRGSELRR